MAKKESKPDKDQKSEKINTAKKNNDIVIEETEDDVVLSSGFNGSPDEMKEEIKKESEKNDVLSRFLVPFFTFIIIGAITAGLTWYYAKPERTNSQSSEEKIQTPPTPTEEPNEAQNSEKPASQATPSAETSKKEENYTIKEGDTLSSVANAYGLLSTELASYNGITDPNSLHIGQVIKIPIK